LVPNQRLDNITYYILYGLPFDNLGGKTHQDKASLKMLLKVKELFKGLEEED
jgi:hypothetical protein